MVQIKTKPKGKKPELGLARFKKVKYQVTGAFADVSEGTILDAYLIVQGAGGIRALVYHPIDKDGCASLDICIKDGPYYVPHSKNDMEGWINLTAQQAKKLFNL